MQYCDYCGYPAPGGFCPVHGRFGASKKPKAIEKWGKKHIKKGETTYKGGIRRVKGRERLVRFLDIQKTKKKLSKDSKKTRQTILG